MGSKVVSKRDLNVNDIVFTKIRDYPPWISIIQQVNGNLANVQFFSKLNERYVLKVFFFQVTLFIHASRSVIASILFILFLFFLKK